MDECTIGELWKRLIEPVAFIEPPMVFQWTKTIFRWTKIDSPMDENAAAPPPGPPSPGPALLHSHAPVVLPPPEALEAVKAIGFYPSSPGPLGTLPWGTPCSPPPFGIIW